MSLSRERRVLADFCWQRSGNARASIKINTMKIITNPNNGGRFTFSEFESNLGKGPGRGLQSVGDALTQAGLPDATAPVVRGHALGVDAMTVAEALANRERPAGELLRACQVQLDMATADKCLSKLAQRMAGAGRIVERPAVERVIVRDGLGRADVRQRMLGGHEWRDAFGAALVALQVWRETGAGAEGEPMSAAGFESSMVDGVRRVRVYTPASRVAWRAIVRALARDTFGESIPLHSITDEWLWHNRELRDESRAERAARLRVERLAVSRQALLLRRLDNIPAGRGKRAETVAKIRTAAIALLNGARLDEAATVAGFKSHGRHKAADHFATALRRVGFNLRGHARQRGDFAKERLA